MTCMMATASACGMIVEHGHSPPVPSRYVTRYGTVPSLPTHARNVARRGPASVSQCTSNSAIVSAALPVPRTWMETPVSEPMMTAGPLTTRQRNLLTSRLPGS